MVHGIFVDVCFLHPCSEVSPLGVCLLVVFLGLVFSRGYFFPCNVTPIHRLLSQYIYIRKENLRNLSQNVLCLERRYMCQCWVRIKCSRMFHSVQMSIHSTLLFDNGGSLPRIKYPELEGSSNQQIVTCWILKNKENYKIRTGGYHKKMLPVFSIKNRYLSEIKIKLSAT